MLWGSQVSLMWFKILSSLIRCNSNIIIVLKYTPLKGLRSVSTDQGLHGITSCSFVGNTAGPIVTIMYLFLSGLSVHCRLVHCKQWLHHRHNNYYYILGASQQLIQPSRVKVSWILRYYKVNTCTSIFNVSCAWAIYDIALMQ